MKYPGYILGKIGEGKAIHLCKVDANGLPLYPICAAKVGKKGIWVAGEEITCRNCRSWAKSMKMADRVRRIHREAGNG